MLMEIFMNSNRVIRKVMIIVCIVSLIALAGCSDMSGDMLTDDTEAAANFADAPAVVEIEHGTILGAPLVVPEDAPTVDIEAVFSRKPGTNRWEPDYYHLEDRILRFRITTSEAPQDDMVILLLGTFFPVSNASSKYFYDQETSIFRLFYVYMVIPKGETATDIYRTDFVFPKEINMGIVDDDHSMSLSFRIIPLRTPLPTLPLKAFLSDFIPPVEVPENYKFQPYRVAEGAQIRAFRDRDIDRSNFFVGDFIVAPDLLNSHLDP